MNNNNKLWSINKFGATAVVTAILSLASVATPAARAQTLTEGFEDVTALQANPAWAFQNNSTAALNLWRQGGTGINSIGPAQAGSLSSYALANYQDTGSLAASNATISNWMITPSLLYDNGSTISFFTRTAAGAPFADRLEVRFSGNGTSADVGATPESVGDFNRLLFSINPNLFTGSTNYPDTWTRFDVTVSGLSTPTLGRVAFRYYVTDAGANGAHSDIVGVDTLSINSTVSAPEPPGLALLIIGSLVFIGICRRKCQRRPHQDWCL